MAHKFQEELYANEAAILPYYIANLNIEHAYMAKTGKYEEFPGICFVDTLDNTDFDGGKGQIKFLGWSKENTQRIKLQNEQDISVIIGNPPYNANQKNENENNKNREYPEIDARIKETYIRAGTAQKTKLYDMYVRFIRWASDRLGDKGILAFVTNSSFIDARSYDGFRKIVAEEFNELWVLDMKGAIRGVAGERKINEGENIFGVRVGIAVWFFVKKSGIAGSDIFYRAVPDGAAAADKFALLAQTNSLDKDDFTHIVSDEKHNWINQTKNGFGKLIPIADKRQKLSRAPVKNTAFKMVSLGVVTSRDDWVYDFNGRNLAAKVKFFCGFYAEEQKRLRGELDQERGLTYKKVMEWKKTGKTPLADWVRRDIKWTSELEAHLSKGDALKYDKSNIIDSSYRPFVNKKIYYGKIITHRQYQMPKIFPTGKTGENKVICFSESLRINFAALAVQNIPSLALFTEPVQCVPLYRYTKDGNKVSNVPEWALEKFRNHYKNQKISAEDIFDYAYAVLHNPAYRKKYRQELMREFPRLPLYKNFQKWAAWGKKLMDLHLNYAQIKPSEIKRTDDKTVKYPLVKLKADKSGGKIVIDTKTVLSGVPPPAWEYCLGKYSALEWVLDQYKEKKIRDATVAAKFNNYAFSDYKESAIDLLARVAAVSVETMKIIKEMENENSGQNRAI
ncbi:MAG: hypothetical protein HAW59_04825 [Betaproteobacteria bacterium]|nr:hypothetical protein [Betaproteobacteria bacterium]